MQPRKVLWNDKTEYGTVYVGTDPGPDKVWCTCENDPMPVNGPSRKRMYVCGHILAVLAGEPDGYIYSDYLDEFHHAREALSPDIKKHGKSLRALRDRHNAFVKGGPITDKSEFDSVCQKLGDLDSLILDAIRGT